MSTTIPLPFIPSVLAWSDDATHIVAGGTFVPVYFGTAGLAVLETATGTVAWHLDGLGCIDAQVAGSFVAVCLGLGGVDTGIPVQHSLEAHDLVSGTRIWQRSDIALSNYSRVAADRGGRLLAVSAADDYAILGLEAGQDIARIALKPVHSFRPVFTPSGSLVAAADAQSVAICNAATGAVLHQIATASAPVVAGFDEAVGTLTIVDMGGFVTVVQAASGTEMSRCALADVHLPSTASLFFQLKGGHLMALSPDRRIVAVAELTSNSLFAAASGVRIGAVPANHDVFGVTRVAFSPEARVAAVTEPTAGMAAMAIAAPRPQVLWQQKSPAAMAAAFSRAGRLAVAQRAAVQPPDATLTNAHGTVLIDPVPPNEPLLSVAVAPGPGGAVLGVDVASSGNGLITCISADQAARLFAVEDGRLLFERGHPGPLNDLVFLRNGQGFATACSDGQVRLFDTASGEQRWFQQYAGAVNALGRPLSGAFVCTAGSDKTVRCLDAATGTQRWQALFPQSVTRVTVSSDGGFAIAACADRTVRLLRASDGTAGWPAPVPHNAPVRALAVTPDGTLVATASQDGIVRVLASDSGSLVRQVSHVQGATSVAFSADGRDVISGSLDGAVLVSAAADPAAPPAQLVRAAAPIVKVRTGPGRSVAVVAQDGLIRLVDLDLQTDLARIYASANVSDIAVDTGRGLIASGADDGTLRVDTWPQP